MRFAPTQEQAEFARSIGDLMQRADSVAVARAWAEGDTFPGLDLWRRLADQGLTALLVSVEDGGIGGTDADLAVAFEALGQHLAVGPWIESAAYLATALTGTDAEQLAAGSVATVAVACFSDRADSAATAQLRFLADTELHRAQISAEPVFSIDRTRVLTALSPTASMPSGDLALALNRAVLAASAELLGAGERLLGDAVAYAKQRRQFGREIGSYQAIKHALADARIALDFARPLVWGAAVDLNDRSASAAKVGASDAAYRCARTALQVHGAIGYTAEFDLGLWLARVRALGSAWGTPTWHRDRVLTNLGER